MCPFHTCPLLFLCVPSSPCLPPCSPCVFSLVFAWFLYVVPSLHPPSILCFSYILPVLYAWPPLSMCAPIHTCPRGSMQASILFCDSVLYACLLPSTHAPIRYSCPCLPHMPQPSTSSCPTEGTPGPAPTHLRADFVETRGNGFGRSVTSKHMTFQNPCIFVSRHVGKISAKKAQVPIRLGNLLPLAQPRPSHTLAGHQRVSGNLPWWWLKTQSEMSTATQDSATSEVHAWTKGTLSCLRLGLLNSRSHEPL